MTELDVMHQQPWVKFECNCPAFYKSFVCKHVLALALAQHKIETPLEFQAGWFSERRGKRKPGRPRKMSKGMAMD